MVIQQEENGLYTAFTLEKGGPIISNTSLEIVKYKFENAFKLATTIRKFEKWKQNQK